MTDLQRQYPYIAQVFSVGTSHERRPLNIIKVNSIVPAYASYSTSCIADRQRVHCGQKGHLDRRRDSRQGVDSPRGFVVLYATGTSTPITNHVYEYFYDNLKIISTSC